MRAVRVRAIAEDNVVVEELPKPEPGPGNVVVKTLKAGICGSDVHTVGRLRRGLDWRNADLRPADLSSEIFVGHEVCGEVAELGEGVEGVRLGERVVIEPLTRCGRCHNCRAGFYNVCDFVDFVVGEYPDRAGAMADYFEIPTQCLVPMLEELDAREGALVEPMAVAVHAFKLGQPGYRPVVGVVGAGTIGLCAVAAAAAAGSSEIIVIARHPRQRDAATALGATRVIETADDVTEEEIKAKLDGMPQPDVVIEAVGGAAASVNLALEFVRKRGSISVIGVQWETNEVNLTRLVAKGVRLIGSPVYATPNGASDFENAMQLMADNPTVADTLVTHDFPLDEARAAFAMAESRGAGSIKVMLTP